jgi:succinyl-diaminopimelate desuccinylase
MKYEIDFLKKLVALNTDAETKTNYTECAKLILKEATKLGLKTKIISSPAKDKLPRPNVIIDLVRGAQETMTIVTHYDIVEPGEGWKTNPFKLRKTKDGLLIGRGVNDDKGAIAASFGALRELLKEKELKRNIRLVCSCDEETGGEHGIKYLSDNCPHEIEGNFALVIDSDTETVGTGCSGIIRGKIRLKGKQYHAGHPYRGKNIIHDSLEFMQEMKEYEKIAEKMISHAPAPPYSPYKMVPGRYSITVLRTNKKINIVPKTLLLGFDLRIIPEANVKKELNRIRSFTKKLLAKHKLKGRISLKGTNGYFIGENNTYANEVQLHAEKIFEKKIPQACSLGGTDGRFINRAGVPAIAFGPGGGNAHEPQESIPIENLKKMKELIIELSKKETNIQTSLKI